MSDDTPTAAGDPLNTRAKDPSPPAIGAQLASAIDHLSAVSPRRPKAQYAMYIGASSAMFALFIFFLRWRVDLADLPLGWVVAFAAAWFLGFASLGFFALVPKTGAVMSRLRPLSALTLTAAAGFILGGLFFAEQAPTSSTYAPSVRAVLGHSTWCLSVGSATALGPIGLLLLFMRGSAPVGSRRTGAAIGAAGGCFSGFFLHFHCHIAEANHVGLIHGGLIGIAAVLGAVFLPRFLRP